MIISEISYLNFDKLYGLLCKKSCNEKTRDTRFLRNLPQLISHVSLNMRINSLTEYEYVFLKFFASNVVKLREFEIDETYVKYTFPEIENEALSQIAVFKDIDSTHPNQRISRMYTPSGFNTTDAVVSFTGSNLLWLLTLSPEQFFIKATENKCLNEDGSLKEDYPLFDNDEFSNFIITEFIHQFYKFMRERASYVDLISDAYNHQIFLKHDITKTVTFLNIRNPEFVVNFSEASMIQKLNEYKSLGKPKAFTIENTEVEIAIRAPFTVFS